jgi:hypothetical protein
MDIDAKGNGEDVQLDDVGNGEDIQLDNVDDLLDDDVYGDLQ